MKPAAFTYHRAHSVAGAVELLAELGEDAKIIAGGQSLVAMMNFRLARPEHLVDITHLDGLAGIDGVGGSPGRDAPEAGAPRARALRIGALTTHRAVEKADLGPEFRVLSDAMRWVGHLPIRTRGTVGGSVAHADATAEWCVLAVLMDAVVVAHGPSGRREIAAGEFFHGPFTTALEPDEMIVEVVFPRPARRAALTEYADRRGDFAIVASAVDLDAPDGPRVVLGGVAPVPVLIRPSATGAARAVADEVAAALELRDEPGISAHYRRGLVRTLTARAFEEAATR